MTIVEEIVLVAFGSFLTLIISILIIFIKDRLDERKNRKITIKKLLIEIKANLKNFGLLHTNIILVSCEAIKQTIISGEINSLTPKLIDSIIKLYGEMNLHNQAIDMGKTDFFNIFNVQNTMKNVEKLLKQETT